MDTMDFYLPTVVLDGLIIAACVVECSLLFKAKHRRCVKKFEPIEILLFSLCISDFLSGASMLIVDTCAWYNEINTGNPVGSFLMDMSDKMFCFFVFLSNFHVLAIAIERVVAVAFPTRYSRLDSVCYKTAAVTFMWGFAAALVSTVYVVALNTFDPEHKDTKIVRTIGFLFTGACVLVFITYTMLFVLLMLRERKLKKLLGADLRKHSRSRRNTYICLLLGCSFVVCVLPFSIGSIEPDYFFGVLPSLLTMNHMFNPIVYFVKYYVDRRRRGASNLSAATVKYNRSSSQTPTTITSMSTSSNGCNVNNACVNHVCNDC